MPVYFPMNDPDGTDLVNQASGYDFHLGHGTAHFPFGNTFFQRRPGGDYLMNKTDKDGGGLPVTFLGVADHAGTWVSPSSITTTQYEPENLKYRVRFITSSDMADVAADFNDAFEVLSKLQTLDRRWTKAPAKNLLVDTAGERAILCSAKVFDKRPKDSDRRVDGNGDYEHFKAWQARNENLTQSVHDKVDELLQTHIPRIIPVYKGIEDGDADDESGYRRLDAREIEDELPGAVCLVTMLLKHNTMGNSGSPFHSFTGNIQQIVIFRSGEDVPATSVFTKHDPNTGPLMLSPSPRKRKASGRTQAAVLVRDSSSPERDAPGPGPTTTSNKTRKTAANTSPGKASARIKQEPKTPTKTRKPAAAIKTPTKATRYSTRKGKGKAVEAHDSDDEQLEYVNASGDDGFDDETIKSEGDHA